MPELARNIAARLRKFIGERRRAPRCTARVALSVSLLGPPSALHSSVARSVAGYSLDISTTGLALVVPAIRIGDHYLAGENRELRIELELPTGPIVLLGQAVRYERLDEEEAERGYLIGVNISTMSDTDRASYEAYLASLLSK